MKQDNFILDKYEQTIETAIENGEFVSAGDLGARKKYFKEATKLYKDLQKTKSITLMVNKEDLIRVKARAKNNRIPYQRLIGALIHKYATGETNVSI